MNTIIKATISTDDVKHGGPALALFHNPHDRPLSFSVVETPQTRLEYNLPPHGTFEGFKNYKNFYARHGCKPGMSPVRPVEMDDVDTDNLSEADATLAAAERMIMAAEKRLAAAAEERIAAAEDRAARAEAKVAGLLDELDEKTAPVVASPRPTPKSTPDVAPDAGTEDAPSKDDTVIVDKPTDATRARGGRRRGSRG